MNTIDEQVRQLARVRDGQLAGRASGAGARALLASIVADTEPAVENRTPSRHRRFGHRPRWPVRVVIAGTAIAGLAAAAIVIPGTLSGNTSPGTPPTVSQPPGTTDTGHLAARKFLLAAATTAMKEPAESGRYWYSKDQTGARIRWSQETGDKAIALGDEYNEKVEELSGKPEELKALREEYHQKLSILRKDGLLPFSAADVFSREGWYARNNSGEISRITTDASKVTFSAPADEEKWTAMGSPELPKQVTESRVFEQKNYSPYGDRFGLFATNKGQALSASDKAGLEKWLREQYDEETRDQQTSESPQWYRKMSFSEWLFYVSEQLLGAPLTPGTRAALYQILAEQPGITSPGRVTDSLGRTGVALTIKSFSSWDLWELQVGEQAEFRLIVDEKTAELLSYEVRPEGQSTPVEWMTFENIGWVDKIGDIPEN